MHLWLSRRPSAAALVLSSDSGNLVVNEILQVFWYFLTPDLQGSQISRGASCCQGTFKPEMFAQMLWLRQIKILLRSASCTCKKPRFELLNVPKRCIIIIIIIIIVDCCLLPCKPVDPISASMSRLLMGHIWMTRWLWGAKGWKLRRICRHSQV